MGYVKAYEETNRTGAGIYEIKSTDRTERTVGFWWCGREYGLWYTENEDGGVTAH